MQRFVLILLLLSEVTGCQLVSHEDSDPLCEPLKVFVTSIKPDSTHEFVLNTAWGGGFKGHENYFYEKQCVDGNYEPAKVVCNYLMQHSSTEFAGINEMRVVSCLSPNTKFAEGMRLEKAQFHFHYGTENRGALIDVTLDEDPVLNAMALRVTAEGY